MKHRALRVARRYRLIVQAGGACLKCGYDKNIASLAFHHIDAKTLKMTGRCMSSTNMPNIQKEVAKCVLLCHNCHGELHNPFLNTKNLKRFIQALDAKAMVAAEACAYYLKDSSSPGFKPGP